MVLFVCSTATACRDICSKVFACDLGGFDALAMLRSEVLPHSHLALRPSPLELWSCGLQEGSCAPQCMSDVLDMNTEPSKRSRAVLSSIPRCVLRFVRQMDVCKFMVQF